MAYDIQQLEKDFHAADGPARFAKYLILQAARKLRPVPVESTTYADVNGHVQNTTEDGEYFVKELAERVARKPANRHGGVVSHAGALYAQRGQPQWVQDWLDRAEM